MLQPDVEAMAVPERERLQLERLRDLVVRLRSLDSPYWRGKLADVHPHRIREPADLALLPFTVKSELRDAFPFGMLAVPLEDTIRVHASSGTRGKPTVVAYTASDIASFAEVNARAIACAGGTANDVLHVAYGYGLFTGGLGLHYGGERLGATVVPASGGNPGLQVELLADLGAAGLCCTPSFAMVLAERAAADGLLDRIRLRYAVCGAEPWSDAFRRKLEAAWRGIDACDIYGLSEVMGPGVAAECREGKGAMHVFDDHFLPEVVDPETGAPVASGRPGELVLTSLTKEALPVIRYRTGDVTTFVDGDCACGRTHRRIGRFTGRVDDMLVIRGVNVFPSEIEAVLLADDAVGAQYAIVVDSRGTMKELEVRAELADAGWEPRSDEVAARLGERLAARLRIRVAIVLGPPGSIPRQELGKARRVFERTADLDPFPG
ncbi:MAG TPA: phenylacetate--CoA ligase [Actinomycetota bacterium]|jgi:phenylacetate-CoA ligase